MRKIIAMLTMALLSVVVPVVGFAQGHATAEEVVVKVREAASTLSKTGDVSQFNQRHSPWVWEDTYIFVQDCEKKVNAAHPIDSKLIGRDLGALKDAKGNPLYPDPQGLCNAARTPSGTWVQYWWPKPGQKGGSRKVTYFLGAPGTPYIVGAGIYDSKDSIAELKKLTDKRD